MSVGSTFQSFSLEMVFLSAAFVSDDWLLVGTKPGHLLLYRIKKDAGRKGSLTLVGYWFGIVNARVNLYLTGTNRFEVTLEKSNKNFSKKIQQVPFKRHAVILNVFIGDIVEGWSDSL